MHYLTPVLLLASVVLAGWDTYPSVPQSASINGFADPIYALLPECAKACVDYSTSSTPCPYWDTGCLCVMPQWSGVVGECFAESCSGTDVQKATSLAESLCTSVGANTWMMPASVSTDLLEAALVSGGSTGVSSTTTAASTSAGNSTVTSGTNSSTTDSSSTSATTGSSSSSGMAFQQSANVLLLLIVGAFSFLS